MWFGLAAAEVSIAPDAKQGITLNFDHISKRAWSDAQTVLIAQADLARAQAQSKQETSFLKPQLSLELQYQHQDEGDATLGQSPLEERSFAQIQAQQFLYGFGRRNQSQRVADNRLQAASAQSSNSAFAAMRSARQAFIQVWLAMADVEVNQSRVLQRQQEFKDVERREAAGTAAGIDTRLAEINALSASNRLVLAQAALEKQLAQLKQLLNYEQSQTCTIVNDLQRIPDFSDALKRAELSIENNQQLDALHAQSQLADAQSQQSMSALYPQLYAFASFSGVGEEFGDLSDQWIVGVSLQWTLYNGSAFTAQSEAFAAQAQSFERQYQDLLNKRRELLKQFSIDHLQLLQRIEQQNKIVTLTEKNYQDTRALYQAGSTTITRLGESSLNLEEARFGLNNLHALLHQLYVELLYFTEMPPAGIAND